MKREIITTADGSKTIHFPDLNEQYHSKHGAIQEAYYVFIEHGLRHVCDKKEKETLSVFEVGFGTGLNTFITLLEADVLGVLIDYVGIEAYPVLMSEVNELNYVEELKVVDKKNIFETLHKSSWDKFNSVTPYFKLLKRKQFFLDIEDEDEYDLVYFDAFGARVQPELWTEELFKIMYKALKEKGVLVTYSAKGSVRRAMQAVGFTVERLPGPPGKREMLRATKK